MMLLLFFKMEKLMAKNIKFLEREQGEK